MRESTATAGSVNDRLLSLEWENRALARELGNLKTLLAASPVGIFRSDRTGQHVFHDGRLYGSLALAPEAAGLGWMTAIHPDDRERVGLAWAAAVRDRLRFAAECRVRCRDGGERRVRAEAEPLFDAEQRFQGHVGSVLDMTERLRAEAELREQTDFLSVMLDAAGTLVLVLEPDGRVVRFNKACERVSGFTFEEMRGRDAWEALLPPDERAAARRAITSGALGPLPIRHRNHWVDRKGEQRLIEWSNTCLRDADGSVKYFICIGLDITERNRVEQALRESEQRFRYIADTMPALLWMADAAGNCIFANRSWLDYTGCRLEEVLGQGWARSVHPDDRDRVLAEEPQVFEGRRPGTSEYRLRGADGGYRWFVDSFRPRFASDGSFLGYIGTLVDITEHRMLAVELAQARDQAELANRAKSEFLANMSHELRTPLNAILGFSEIIRDRRFGPDAVDKYAAYAADIHSSGKHLLDVINDILDMSKIEAGRYEPREEPVALAAVAAACISILRTCAREGQVEIRNELPECLPRLKADQRAIKQVVLHLLSNAVKFTPPGGHVALGAAATAEGGLAITIADTGIGIPEEARARLFEPFQQVDATIRRQYEGTGLGLSICKKLVDLHGGRLALDSAPGQGTAVTVLFPAGRVLRADAAP